MNDEIANNKTAPERFQFDLQGGSIAGWRWANPSMPPLLYCHATGFCASAYKQMLGALSHRFDVFALDMRGHGRTTAPRPVRLRSWRVYADDIARFLDQQNRMDWTLAGHSMGAVTATMAARGRDDIAALRLIEPVAMPVWFSKAAATPLWPLVINQTPMVRQASRRRNGWPDRDAVLASYGRKALFKRWAPGVLADYLEDGLIDGPDGVELACDPAWEAATFGAQANDFWACLDDAPAPVSVLASDHSSSTVARWARQRMMRKAVLLMVANELTHLAPMENPIEMASFVAS